MARPRRYREPMDTVTIRVTASDWAELGQVAGDLRPEVVRHLIAHYLRRPHVPMPALPPDRPIPEGRRLSSAG